MEKRSFVILMLNCTQLPFPDRKRWLETVAFALSKL